MPTPPSFAPIAASLRDEVIEHYERAGVRLDTPSGRRTLDTNSTLAADRGRLLLRFLAETGAGPIAGRRVLDLGAGFGALSVYFAHLGAEVVAVDPNRERLLVGVTVSRMHGLAVNAVQAHADALPLPDSTFHFAVLNNALCYIVARGARRDALSEVLRVLMPRGWLVTRDPNRLTPIDPFTGLPLLALAPPALGRRIARSARRHRSDVRLNSPFGAAFEVRRAGFVDVRVCHPSSRRVIWPVARYHHLVARRPAPAIVAT
jgi:ubiquinone/menaquinone biosynthesis C-methylase UbiE